MSSPQIATMRNVHGSRPSPTFTEDGISAGSKSAPSPLTQTPAVTGSSTNDSSPHSRPKATGSCQIEFRGLETPG